MSKTEIFVFRHGETDWNLQRRLQGHTDIPLNQKGLKQAQDLRTLLSRCGLQALVSSDLSRALKTAEVVNEELQVPLFITSHLRECYLGQAEGLYLEKVVELYGQSAWERWLSVSPQDHEFIFIDCETKQAHLRRLLNYLEAFCLKNPDIEVLGVSTHGASLRRLIHHCEGAPIEPIPLPNCVVYKIVFDHDQKQWQFVGPVLS